MLTYRIRLSSGWFTRFEARREDLKMMQRGGGRQVLETRDMSVHNERSANRRQNGIQEIRRNGVSMHASYR